MHNEIINLFGINITGWKLLGYIGVSLFTARWFVQMLASRKAGKPVVPRLFWFLSVAGSLMCLTYFIVGKNDSVGILGYLFPTCVSLYNLALDGRHRNQQKSTQ
jgi:lipid-A-disaccharide synthase-like uncharacterized protein